MNKRSISFKMPHPYVIVFVLLLLASLLTYVIPAGEFERYKNDAGITVVDPDSFHYVESSPASPLKIPSYIMKGLANQSTIIFALLVIGGALEVILATGMFHVFCRRLTVLCVGKERLFIPIITLAFAFVGFTQAPDRFISFAPIGVMLAAALGYDAIVGIGMILLGIAVGFSAGTFSSVTAVAQEIAELPAYSGMWMRVLATVLLYVVTTWYLMRYAERSKKDPTKSIVYGDIDVKTFELPKEEAPITGRHIAVLLIFVATFAVMMYGCMKFGWGLTETAVCFLYLAIIGGIAFGFGPSRIAKEFTKGCKGMAGTTVIIGLGATVAVILTEGKTLDTVVMALASTLNVFPQFLRGVALLLINTIVNFFVVSGNGQAAVVMPVLTPACDLANISRQTCVFAFKMGDGFSNYIYPHCSSLMGFLSMAGIAWNKWMKFMGKLFGLWMLIGSLLLVMCYFVGY